jgi:phage/plasmid-like protein (TIGR03299 family)
MSTETLDWLNQNTLIGYTSLRGKAWHYRKGSDNHFAGAVPEERALELLSYPVAESASIESTVVVITETGVEERTFTADKHKSIIRLDTGETFEFFKLGYQMHQPREWCLEYLDLILSGGLQIASVVVLKGGAVAALQAELPETFKAKSKGAEPVAFRPFVTAATSFNGSIATTYGRGAQVVVCDNTLAVALRSFDGVTKIRHSARSLERVGEIRTNLALIVEEVGDAFSEQVKLLTAQHVSNSRFNDVVDAYTGASKAKEGRGKTIADRKVKVLKDLWKHDERVAPWKNSAYGVLAAFNTAQHHYFGTEKTRVERNQQHVIEGKWNQFDDNVLRLLAAV